MQKIIYFITFFLFSGYYAVLAILISLGMSSTTRTVTVPLRLMSTLLMLYVIVRLFKKQRIENYKKWIYLFFLSFWLLYFLKVLQNYNAGVDLMRNWFEYIFYAFNFCILPFIMFSFLDFNTLKKTILNSLIFSGFIMGLITLFLYKEVLSMDIGRISMLQYETGEETLNPLALSYAGALTVTLCLYEILYNKFKSKKYIIYLYTTIVLSAIMFFIGSSRGSVAAFIFSLPILFYYGSRKNKKNFIFIAMISIPLVIFGALKTGSSIFERTSETITTGNIGLREQLWEVSWGIFLANPLLGGTIEIINAPGYNGENIYPHNFILELLMATGIIGFVLYMFFLIPAFVKIRGLIKNDLSYVWVLLVLIQGIFQNLFSGALYTAVLILVSLGLIYAKKTIPKN